MTGGELHAPGHFALPHFRRDRRDDSRLGAATESDLSGHAGLDFPGITLRDLELDFEGAQVDDGQQWGALRHFRLFRLREIGHHAVNGRAQATGTLLVWRRGVAYT